MELKSEAKYILNRLNEYGKGYLVGGAVRDILISKVPSDFDFATNLDQKKIIEIFKDNNPTVLSYKYQVTRIKINNNYYDIARFREETGKKDNRNPQTIIFKDNIKEDLKRRDLTINAICYNEKEGIIDIFGGLKDIEKKIIRMIGDPKKRLEEDHIRILRIFKYVAKLNFKLDNNLLNILKTFSRKDILNNNNVVRENIEGILFSKYSLNSIKLMNEVGIIKNVFEIFKGKKDNKNILKELDNLYKKANKYYIYMDKEIMYTSLFIIFSKYNKNYLKNLYNNKKQEDYAVRLAMNFLYKLSYDNKYINQIIENIKIYFYISKKSNFNEEHLYKTSIKLFESNVNISKLGIIYDLINNNIEILEKLQEAKKLYIPLSDIELKNIDIRLPGLNFYNKEIEYKRKIRELIFTKQLINSKISILKYLYNTYGLKWDFLYEYSSGAVIVKKENAKPRYLLVKVLDGNWGFAKGHLEENETYEMAAKREVLEETNLDIEMIDYKNLYEEIEYIIYSPGDKNILKKIRYYLGYSNNGEVKIDPKEISEYAWLSFNEAYKLITFTTQRKILLKMHKYVIRSLNER